MSNPFKTPSFKKQQKEWNKILVKNGHQEIEDFSLPEPPLLRNEASYFRKIDTEYYALKLIYYEKARELLHTFKFKNVLHRRIWEMHSEGISAREIARIIDQKKVKKSTVHNIISLIKKEIVNG